MLPRPMARHVRRGFIVAKIKPGSEEKVAELFAESDREGELPSIMGVTHRSLAVLGDVYIHYVEMDEDLAQKGWDEHGGPRPLPRDKPQARRGHPSVRAPETWRSPNDAGARACSTPGTPKPSDPRRSQGQSRSRRPRARPRRAAARDRGRPERFLRAGRSRLPRARCGQHGRRGRALPPGARARAGEHRRAAGHLDHPRAIRALGGCLRRGLGGGGRSARTIRSPCSRLAELALDMGRLDEASSAFQRLRSVDERPVARGVCVPQA